MAHEVVGPLAVVKDDSGKLRYYYSPAVLPADLPAEEIKRLVELGVVAEVKGQAKPPASAPAPGVRPSASAAKAVWVEYAVSRGMDRDEADKLTRDQLAEQYSDGN